MTKTNSTQAKVYGGSNIGLLPGESYLLTPNGRFRYLGTFDKASKTPKRYTTIVSSNLANGAKYFVDSQRNFHLLDNGLHKKPKSYKVEQMLIDMTLSVIDLILKIITFMLKPVYAVTNHFGIYKV